MPAMRFFFLPIWLRNVSQLHSAVEIQCVIDERVAKSYFSCPLDKGTAKICKKLKSHGGILNYLQDRTANLSNLAVIFCPALVCPQKAIVGIKFCAYFCSPLVKWAWKMLSNRGNTFCCMYFTTLETYCVLLSVSTWNRVDLIVAIHDDLLTQWRPI